MGDQQRGYLLELLLTKLRYSTASVDEEVGEGLQIVGMSATMSNAAAFAQWLDAQLYETSFRPVQLRKFVKVCSLTCSFLPLPPGKRMEANDMLWDLPCCMLFLPCKPQCDMVTALSFQVLLVIRRYAPAHGRNQILQVRLRL